MLSALEVVTTVAVGVMVGVEFSVAFVMNRILNALPEDSGQLGHAHGGRMLGAVMPVWYIASLVLVGVWAVAGRHHHGTGLVVTAFALLLLSVVMSLLLLVPINSRNKTWTPDNRPADWKQQLNRWERLHYVRVAVIIAAFTLLVAALA
ncbi:anthrone oxygenase family protein [Streptomyces cinereospinus]|uniref:Anthrone oxygenase family protein n=1 Tax=Streptomyces cinereospinus TaxID=285561 RepID=A0ABV5N2U3_9ACTN